MLVMRVKCTISFASVPSLIAINYNEVRLQILRGMWRAQHNADAVEPLAQIAMMWVKGPSASSWIIKVRPYHVSAKKGRRHPLEGVECQSLSKFSCSPVKLKHINLHNIQLSMKISWWTKLHSGAAQEHANKLGFCSPRFSSPWAVSVLKWCKTCLTNPYSSSVITYTQRCHRQLSTKAVKYLPNWVC